MKNYKPDNPKFVDLDKLTWRLVFRSISHPVNKDQLSGIQEKCKIQISKNDTIEIKTE